MLTDPLARLHRHGVSFRSSVRLNHLRERRGLFCASKNSEFYGPVAAIHVSGRNMIATCANPSCNVPFRYFRSGKIFVLDANDVDPGSGNRFPKRRIEYFGLCGNAPENASDANDGRGSYYLRIFPVSRPSWASKNHLFP
jgi:hypothetical protein